ncbi:hypothetical protein RvY_13311 [Ramazzottius varieornatus]|uniref:Uncharacterized protein n=1 Tax=Ramazzottius varieornatus TaxID=947166 RepID=A0A1D1VMG9_RAMVA|nr:hypothetical protein RvY_13311 [Ramazzottius varieornatus]
MAQHNPARFARSYAALKIFTLDKIRSSTSKENQWGSKGAVPFDKEKLDGLRGMTAKYVQVKGNHPALDYAKLQNQISQIKVQIIVQSKAKKPSA